MVELSYYLIPPSYNRKRNNNSDFEDEEKLFLGPASKIKFNYTLYMSRKDNIELRLKLAYDKLTLEGFFARTLEKYLEEDPRITSVVLDDFTYQERQNFIKGINQVRKLRKVKKLHIDALKNRDLILKAYNLKEKEENFVSDFKKKSKHNKKLNEAFNNLDLEFFLSEQELKELKEDIETQKDI